MSELPYEVTARKYRPQRFADVVGQEHVTRTLQNALRTLKIHHAYLFCGPRGTGKTTTARLLAKALNCLSAETMVAEPCGTCSSCQAIGRGSGVDVMEIDGASNNSVDQMRDLRETVGYAPMEGRYKVYIIDEVHMLTSHAFNALLKTLEEPPRHVVFIFATTEPTKVLPTIMSRVQRYDFRRIGVETITESLKMIAAREEVEADPEALNLIARKADGALRDAQSLLDQVRAFSAGERLSLEQVRTVLGVADTEHFFALTHLAAGGNAAGAFELAARLADSGQDPREFMLGYAEHLRHLVAAAVGGEVGLEALPESEKERYREQRELFGLEDLLRRLELAGRTADALRTSGQPWITLEAAFLRLVTLDRAVDLRRLIDRLERELPTGRPDEPASGNVPAPAGKGVKGSRAASKSRSRPTQSTAAPPEADGDAPPPPLRPPTEAYEEQEPPQAPPVDRSPAGGNGGSDPLSQVRAHWDDLLAEIHRHKVTLAVFLAEARLEGIEENDLVLLFHGENHTFHINVVSRHVELIREATRTVLGKAYGVRCRRQTQPAGASRGKRDEPLNDQLLRRLCDSDPALDRIVALFDATLEDGPGGRPGA